MGSYDVSCSLTGTPIYSGDPCVFVVLRKGFDFTRETLAPHAEFHIEAVIKTSYDDYGFPHGTAEYPNTDVHAMVDGLWTPRGNPEKGRLHFFVCQEAWEWCQEPGNVPFLTPTYLKDLIPLQQEMARVLVAFQRAHRNLLAGFGATGQWYCPDDFDSVIENAELTIACCKAARKHRMAQEKEWGMK